VRTHEGVTRNYFEMNILSKLYVKYVLNESLKLPHRLISIIAQ